jgi:beta-phosphoglucomutase
MLSTADISQPKPDPEIYTKAMAMLSCRPDECLVVEDNENGVRAAKAAGAHVLVVKEVDDVNIDNITARIEQIEKGLNS